MDQMSPMMRQYIANSQNGTSPAVQPPAVNYVNNPIEATPVINQQPIQDTFVKANESQNTDEKKSDKKKKALIIGGIIAAVAVTAGIIYAVMHGKKCKADKIAKETAEKARKAAELENIVKNVDGVQDVVTGENTTIEKMMDRYLKDYDVTGKTFYHGTGLETAEIIKKEGIKTSYRGDFSGNFKGAYFTEKLDCAKGYAEQAASFGRTPNGAAGAIKATAGGVVTATLPDGAKLAQFANDEGKTVSIALADDLFGTQKITQALEKSKLTRSDLIEYVQEILKNKGYDGIRAFDSHTGWTPVIFNREKLQFGDIIKI